MSRRIAETACDDLRFMLRNVSIGVGAVFLIQVVLKFTTAVDPDSFAAAERQVWDLLVKLKLVLSAPALLIGLVVLVLVAGLLFKTWLPAVASARMRKGAGAVSTVLASMLMFSFVTAKAAETRFPETTESLRAEIVSSLADVAKARREAAAYQWASAMVERELADPDFSDAAVDLAIRIEAQCHLTDLQAAEVNRTVDQSLQIESCNRSFISHAVLKELLLSDEAREGAQRAHDSDREPSIDLWTPEFKGLTTLTNRSAADEPAELVLDLEERTTSLADLEQLKSKAQEMSRDAEGARNAMRASLVKVLTNWLDAQLPVPGLADYFVDNLRDAVISQMAREAENRTRERLSAIKQGSLEPSLAPSLVAGLLASKRIFDPAERAKLAKRMFEALYPGRIKLAASFRKAGSMTEFRDRLQRDWARVLEKRRIDEARGVEIAKATAAVERAKAQQREAFRGGRRGR